MLSYKVTVWGTVLESLHWEDWEPLSRTYLFSVDIFLTVFLRVMLFYDLWNYMYLKWKYFKFRVFYFYITELLAPLHFFLKYFQSHFVPRSSFLVSSVRGLSIPSHRPWEDELVTSQTQWVVGSFSVEWLCLLLSSSDLALPEWPSQIWRAAEFYPSLRNRCVFYSWF